MTQENPELTCNACGTKTSKSQKFCGDCGERLPLSPQPSSAAMPNQKTQGPSIAPLSHKPVESAPVPTLGFLQKNRWYLVLGLGVFIVSVLFLASRNSSLPPTANASAVPVLETEQEEHSFEKAKQRATYLAEIERQKQLEQAKTESLAIAAFENLSGERDEVRGLTWYRSTLLSDASDHSILSLYFGGLTSGLGPLRLKISYTSSEWLFIQSFIIKADDKRFDISVQPDDLSSDHSSNQIWEWYDASIPEEQFEMLDRIANSKKAILRYEGRLYHSDREITPNEKEGIKTVLEAYRTVGALPIERQTSFFADRLAAKSADKTS